MLFRISIQLVRVFLITTNKNAVIHYSFSQSQRIAIRGLIKFTPASPLPLLLTPVQAHYFQQATHLLANEVAGGNITHIPHKNHVAVRPHHLVPQVDIIAPQHHGNPLCNKTTVPVIHSAGNVQPAALGNITGMK